ncbi:hypothetical protein RFI_37536 [Reticulomyxa filosa]|uniref:Uncharacterized protein n=1 Tax=Reticulomyxa filosa TaxID=46433 RepID=X6LFP2_RETFI|nr:hypothetical protein RFI_37536 [Reticulomyxa filosa]|eukprot:ETN99931.1 hypothetical protein RFI_37536 [Reticulomyxa filosa]
MVEEPFLLQIILSVLPLLVKKYGVGSRISKAQVYEVFNDQLIDINIQNIITKLSELRIQMNINKIKSILKQYCLDLGFDMFQQGSQIAIEPEFQYQNDNDIIWSKLDPEIENENKTNIIEEKTETEMKTINTTVAKTQDIWEKYFNGDKLVIININFYINHVKNIMQHKKLYLISFHGNLIQQFQQFETYAQQFLINNKLLNKEMGIIQFIADRIYDNNLMFVNLKSRLFRLIESSKNKCIWQGGCAGLSLKGSTWKDAKGVTFLQMSVVEHINFLLVYLIGNYYIETDSFVFIFMLFNW